MTNDVIPNDANSFNNVLTDNPNNGVNIIDDVVISKTNNALFKAIVPLPVIPRARVCQNKPKGNCKAKTHTTKRKEKKPRSRRKK